MLHESEIDVSERDTEVKEIKTGSWWIGKENIVKSKNKILGLWASNLHDIIVQGKEYCVYSVPVN